MVSCGDFRNHQSCGELCVGERWFSKLNHRVNDIDIMVNARQVCIENGYDSVIVEYGSNGGNQCKYPGNAFGEPNKEGGSLDALGTTVTWKCELGKF